MNGYSNDTMNNSALNEASSNFTIENWESEFIWGEIRFNTKNMLFLNERSRILTYLYKMSLVKQT
jgi:hypothetical protein